jgi:hypothetical protein
MQLTLGWKKTAAVALLCTALGAGLLMAANSFNKPKSVIHVITLYYKDGVTDDQKKTVATATEKMASEIPGIKNIWLKPVRVQGEVQEKQADGSVKARRMTDIIVIEFESEAAFKAYADHPAHKAWESIYVPLRGQSRTSQATN